MSAASFLASARARARAYPWRPVAFSTALAAAIALGSRHDGAGGDRTGTLVRALAREGLTASDVAWVDRPPRGLVPALTQSCRALVRANARGEPNDLYLVRARLSPEGALVGVAGIANLTRTPS